MVHGGIGTLRERRRAEPADGEALPFVIGSAGTLCFDLSARPVSASTEQAAILFQSLIYADSGKSPRRGRTTQVDTAQTEALLDGLEDHHAGASSTEAQWDAHHGPP